MKTKYWAKKKYSAIDPNEYIINRFSTPAGRKIDEAEKKAAVDILLRYLPQNKVNRPRILDVATGAGRLAFYLERKIQHAEITGVDINENMLYKAKQQVWENKSKIKFVKGDVYNLPFKDNQFDAVVGLRFSMHLPQIKKILQEFSRILKKDGIVIFDIFNFNSILRLKVLSKQIRFNSGFYTKEDIIKFSSDCGLKYLGYKGILLFGETILRKISGRLLFLLFPIIKPPRLLENYATKLLLCFKKI